MNTSKLGLDYKKIQSAKQIAKNIAGEVQEFVNQYTTVSVERSLCRLLGIDGVNANDIPLPNIVVDQIQENKLLNEGILFFLGNAIIETGLTPQKIAEKIANEDFNICKLPIKDKASIEKAVMPYVDSALKKIKENLAKREE